jgi:thioredoxin-related protein
MPRGERLARVAIALAVAAVAIVGATAILIARPDLRARFGLAREAYAVDQVVDVPHAIYDSSSYTLLIFARSTCEVCQRSAGFLRRLAGETAVAGGTVRLVSSTPVVESELAFARGLGLVDGQVAPVDLRTLRLRRVPTIVLVDRHGAIHYALEGAVPASDQEDVIKRLISLTH